MSRLQQLGYRLMVSKELEDARWTHPADIPSMTGYVDCTDMDDAQFESFMRLVSL